MIPFIFEALLEFPYLIKAQIKSFKKSFANLNSGSLFFTPAHVLLIKQHENFKNSLRILIMIVLTYLCLLITGP